MRAVIQRVSEASVVIEDSAVAQIKKGLLVLLGIEDLDSEEDIRWLSNKIAKMRIFSDENGLMNKSIQEIEGNIIVVSQFTLFASTKKGNRPGFTRSAKPEIAIPLYEKFVSTLSIDTVREVQTGEFGADMKVSLINDGPVTITIDTKDKE
ncbi:D-aminoacyl-tRNA deacylase [Pseudofulvibacter geojedonensis]|uniref:D-aminoacyl-tRNA deacylase n=1 Tax=Pseudofulvibacter geojedonensis TaxID=1123758 RepID=A0ABW3I0Z2_9FLAO